jgi:hypothetical protein
LICVKPINPETGSNIQVLEGVDAMPPVHDAYSVQIAIADLLPTQVTVGMREVDIRRIRWRGKNAIDCSAYLASHRVPVVLGPNKRYYMIDRHHLTMALSEEGVTALPVSVIADMSALCVDDFWTSLESRAWTHPFDDEGRRRLFEDMPIAVADLEDDPYRSLAGAVKRAGGYAKNKAPFSEFRWADFLRLRIARNLVERDFGRALAIAMNLAQSNEAAGLPGWQYWPSN